MPLLHAAEDRHFWFRARNALLAALIDQIEPTLAAGYRVLEVGCGTGNTLRVLDRACTRGTVVGMDFQREGLRLARARVRCSLVQGDITTPPFHRDVFFDLIGMFDVLEHIDDDRRTLEAVRSRLSPGGVLILTVPADPRLWSAVDVAAGHCRRYTLEELQAKLHHGGFRIEYLSPIMRFLHPLVRIARTLSGQLVRDRFDSAATELRITPIVNGLVYRALMREVPLITRRSVLPYGTSLVAIARYA
ncbi:MAG: class I SAM-dependent methyltransferase [Vicinamibacterales bacterium]